MAIIVAILIDFHFTQTIVCRSEIFINKFDNHNMIYRGHCFMGTKGVEKVLWVEILKSNGAPMTTVVGIMVNIISN